MQIDYNTTYWFKLAGVDKHGTEGTLTSAISSSLSSAYWMRNFCVPWRLASLTSDRKRDTAQGEFTYSPGAGYIWAISGWSLTVGDVTEELYINDVLLDSAPSSHTTNPKDTLGIYLDEGDELLHDMNSTAGGEIWTRYKQYYASTDTASVICSYIQAGAGPYYTVTTNWIGVITYAYSPTASADLEMSTDGGGSWQVLIEDVNANKHTLGNGGIFLPSAAKLRTSAGSGFVSGVEIRP